ncbi:MAG: hypothetical protein ACOYN5_15960 [Bacteroidales bacterium]
MTEKKQQGGCGEVLRQAQHTKCCKKTEKPEAIAFLPVRNALQGRWIFDAQGIGIHYVCMNYGLKRKTI